MKIWFLTPTFPPVRGGSETQAFTLAAGLVREGHSVSVLTERYPGSSAVEELAGVRVHRSRTDPERWRSPDRVPWEERVFGLLRDAQDLITPDRTDVLQTFCQVGAVLGAMMTSSLRCPLVVTMNETTPHTDPFGSARTRLVYGHLPYDAVVTGSAEYQRQAIEYGADPARVHLARYGIDGDLYGPGDGSEVDEARQWLRVAPGDQVVLLVGRFKERKGQRELVRAMTRVTRRHPRARAVLVGSLNSASVAYQRQVEQDIADADLSERVLLRTSALPFGSLRAIYTAATVVVQPSHSEGLGLSAIEAIAAGRPLIATAVPGLSEVLESCPGTVSVPPKDPDALADAICAVLDNPEKAERGARRARAAVRREFDARDMVGGYLKVYERLRATEDVT
ncbi:glycosyltransferase family 4 protein [Streptomyces sp. MB09-02B]|uniref:glycosyltransferase family 4 protein n=1 Tax=Streptomyces sp. MB09-02B TaxID=3028667 RepID=UPI0029A64E32|nr:glycosyltransferase family 4 protein [Streptomyces sp. MB09-02B]MDX3639998.1 glycosyltransferase family 4 protein [Streptomyces sp. MB09-02B]